MLGSRAASVLLALVLLVSFTAAWTKEDHEIFRLNDEVTSAEERQNTFTQMMEIALELA